MRSQRSNFMAVQNKICEHCGDEYTPSSPRAWESSKYCKDECRKAANAVSARRYRHEGPLTPQPKICEVCGTEYLTVQNTSRYCSITRDADGRTCRQVAQLATMQQKSAAVREARFAKGDMRMRDKPIASHTRAQLDEVRKILDIDNGISVRSCCYHLLTLGLLNSTKDFSNMAKKINAARKRHEDDRDYLPDEGFRDGTRVMEWNHGWSGGIDSYIDAYVRVYERDHWENQKVIPIILCEKSGHGDFLRATTKAEQYGCSLVGAYTDAVISSIWPNIVPISSRTVKKYPSDIWVISIVRAIRWKSQQSAATIK
jgi:hypothetical protein